MPKFALAELPGIADYRAMVADAGLVLEEVLDVSEHTKRTVPVLVEGVREHRADLEQEFGDAAKGLIEVLLHPVATLPEYGYLVITAHAPR